ncbi:elongin-A-like isoform X2 [Corticium candelabrum]|nr:elongin-A-like isoform X2 [Corticium candelabrum]
MTVYLLQGTGVGKTVNRLSRLDGQLAQTAKSLVRQWRKLVKEGDDSQTLAKFQQETNTSNSKDCRQSKLKRQRVESTCNDINLSVSSIPGKDNDNASSFCHKKKRIEVGTVDEPVPIYTPNPGTIRGSRSEETSIYQRKRTAAVADVNFMIGSSRRSLSLVYSGRKRKGATVVPSLFQLSMQVLTDNIDALDEVGGVPYSILKPVLLKCSPSQLFHLEERNPHFLVDCDDLWKSHCQRDFKNCEHGQGQTWRELYLMRHTEREEKLKSITQKIGKNMETYHKEQKDKQVKLAKASSLKTRRCEHSGLHVGTSRMSFGHTRNTSKAHPMMTKVRKMVSTQRMKGWRPC